MGDRTLDIKLRWSRSSQPPWSACPMNQYVFSADGNMVCELRGHGAEVSGQRKQGEQDRNAEAIANAPTDIAALLDHVSNLEAENARLREAGLAAVNAYYGLPVSVDGLHDAMERLEKLTAKRGTHG